MAPALIRSEIDIGEGHLARVDDIKKSPNRDALFDGALEVLRMKLKETLWGLAPTFGEGRLVATCRDIIAEDFNADAPQRVRAVDLAPADEHRQADGRDIWFTETQLTLAWRRANFEILKQVARRAYNVSAPAWTLAEAEEILARFAPVERAKIALMLIRNIAPGAFWPTLLDGWTATGSVDAATRVEMLDLAKHHPTPFRASADRDDAAFFDKLPERIPVYRGGDAIWIFGASWTTNRVVAETFAGKTRGVSNPDSVIARGVIRKERVLFAAISRGEAEIVADPFDVEEVYIDRYRPEQLAA